MFGIYRSRWYAERYPRWSIFLLTYLPTYLPKNLPYLSKIQNTGMHNLSSSMCQIRFRLHNEIHLSCNAFYLIGLHF